MSKRSRNAHPVAGVESARRVLNLLLLFSEDRPSLSLEDVIDESRISAPSAYRYLALLRELDLIEERKGGVYVLSPKFIQFSRAAERSFGIGALAQAVLDRLAGQVDETALLMKRSNQSAACIAIADSSQTVTISFTPGHLMPLHAGAGAKLLLADLSTQQVRRYLDEALPLLLDAERRVLLRELAEISHTGFAESHGEVDEGLWACAASIRDSEGTTRVVSVVAPDYRLSAGKKAVIKREILAAARDLEVGFDRRFKSL